MRVLLISLLLFTSCSIIPVGTDSPVFKKYVLTFEKYYGQKIPDHITIRFVDHFPGTATAKCYPGLGKVLVSLEQWNMMTELEREWVLFHELGHCVLFREHDNERILGGLCPRSIMHPWFTRDLCYKMKYDYYIKELFNPSKRCRVWCN